MAGIITWATWAAQTKSIIKVPVNLEAFQLAAANNVRALRENIMANFNALVDREVESLVYPVVEAGQGSIDAFKAAVVFTLYNTYLSPQVADELDLPEDQRGVQDVIDRLYDEMLEDSQTVLENTVSASGAADVDNTGNGSLFVTVKDSENLDNEFVIPEVITVECTSDNAINQVTRGEETFQISGEPVRVSSTHLQRGSGIGETIQPATASGVNKIQNGTFDTFSTADTPDNWDIDSGVVSTNILEETATANVFHGDASLKLIDVAGATTIQLSQTFSGGNIPLGVTKYSGSVQVKTVSFSSGTLTIKVVGTGVSETIFTATAPGTAGFAETQVFFDLPDTIPDDLEIEIKMVGGNAGAIAYIDDLAIMKVVYHAGVGFALTRGVVDWVQEDRIEVTVANDEAGNIQSFFGRYYGRKFPSATSGAETINDAL